MRWSPKPLEVGPRDGFKGTDLFKYRALARISAVIGDGPNRS